VGGRSDPCLAGMLRPETTDCGSSTRMSGSDAVALRFPGAAIPYDDGAAAVLALGNRSFEGAVFERVVLDLDGEALPSR
jgi:hypothetical protein